MARTEKEKMLAGELYRADSPEIVADQAAISWATTRSSAPAASSRAMLRMARPWWEIQHTSLRERAEPAFLTKSVRKLGAAHGCIEYSQRVSGNSSLANPSTSGRRCKHSSARPA